MAIEHNKYTHLIELGESEYEIVDGEPDIRGWDVKNRLGVKLGEVDELLFNPESCKVRYIVVDVDNNEFSTEQKKILIPIGTAVLYDNGRLQDNKRVDLGDNIRQQQADLLNSDLSTSTYNSGENTSYDPSDDGKVVIVPITEEHLNWLPAYTKEGLSPHTELATRRAFLGLNDPNYQINETEYNAEEFYNHEHFNEDQFYSTPTKSNLRRKL